MITKHLVLVSFASAALSSCGSIQSLNSKTGTQESAEDSPMTDDEEAANRVYLDEVEDSADETDDPSVQVDSSVHKDLSERRLTQMANMKFDRLDKDNSETLSLDEFLAGPRENPKFEQLSSEKQTKKIEKMTADFKKYAGSDDLLAVDELKTLLKEVAPRIGRHRHKNHGGRHEDRIKQGWEEIVKQYDKDGDQKLSQEEYEALKSDRSQKHKSWGKRKHKDHGPGPMTNEDNQQTPPPPPPSAGE